MEGEIRPEGVQIPKKISAAIETINRGAGHIDRNDLQAILNHNEQILAAQEILREWIIQAPLDQGGIRKQLVERMIGSQPKLPDNQPDRSFGIGRGEGHTHPINPTVFGTGLKGQEKPPKYNKKGELA